jgi:hypothetical protein
VNLSLDTWHASPSYILGPVFRSFSPSLLVSWVFMAAVWRKVQDSHAFLLAVIYCPYGQMRIMVACKRITGLSFRRPSICHEMFYISYTMLLRHLPRWMDGVFSDRVAEVLLPRRPSPFCSILPKSENKSENRSPRFYWPSAFLQSSHSL